MNGYQNGDIAERLLERALQERGDGLDDAIITATAALDAMRIEAAELPESELGAVLAYLDEPCTCPPELAARGGFRGSCPTHGVGGGGE